MQRKIYNNTTTYKRCTHSEEHPYTIISNYLIRSLESEDPNKRINFTELGFMTYLLSNADTYIFNSEYVQKFVSGVGQDKYYNAVKHLKELGYIKKNPKKEGGWNWEINEILFHISTKVSDKDLKTIDNARISENPNRENPNREIPNTENPNREIPNTENTSLRSNNQTIASVEVKKEKIEIERNNNLSMVGDRVENKTLDIPKEKNFNLDSEADHTSKIKVSQDTSNGNTSKIQNDQDTSKVESHNTPSQDLEHSDNTDKSTTNILVENECQKIITHPNCKHIFQSNDKWRTFSEKLSKYSNSAIGYEVSKYLIKYCDNPNQKLQSDHTQFLQSDEGRFMNYLFYIAKYSQRLEDSKIWKSLQYELGLEYKDRLLKTFDLS